MVVPTQSRGGWLFLVALVRPVTRLAVQTCRCPSIHGLGGLPGGSPTFDRKVAAAPVPACTARTKAWWGLNTSPAAALFGPLRTVNSTTTCRHDMSSDVMGATAGNAVTVGRHSRCRGTPCYTLLHGSGTSIVSIHQTGDITPC